MKNWTTKILFLSSLVFSAQSLALSIVVHPSNANSITKDDVVRIFLGKQAEFANGSKATPLGLGESNEATAQFVSQVLNKTPAQLKSYWAKRIFTGQGEPPKALGGDDELIKTVAQNPDAIGFIAGAGTEQVKVVLSF